MEIRARYLYFICHHLCFISRLLSYAREFFICLRHIIKVAAVAAAFTPPSSLVSHTFLKDKLLLNSGQGCLPAIVVNIYIIMLFQPALREDAVGATKAA